MQPPCRTRGHVLVALELQEDADLFNRPIAHSDLPAGPNLSSLQRGFLTCCPRDSFATGIWWFQSSSALTCLPDGVKKLPAPSLTLGSHSFVAFEPTEYRVLRSCHCCVCKTRACIVHPEPCLFAAVRIPRQSRGALGLLPCAQRPGPFFSFFHGRSSRHMAPDW